MKVEKFKVLLYLKKSSLDKSGKVPIMGLVTVNHSMVQLSCKLSCSPNLWNPRESRLSGKSNEALITNVKLDKLLLAVHSAYDSLVERKQDFDATSVKDLFQGSMVTRMSLLKLLDRYIEEMKARIEIGCSPKTILTYVYTICSLEKFVSKKFKP